MGCFCWSNMHVDACWTSVAYCLCQCAILWYLTSKGLKVEPKCFVILTSYLGHFSLCCCCTRPVSLYALSLYEEQPHHSASRAEGRRAAGGRSSSWRCGEKSQLLANIGPRFGRYQKTSADLYTVQCLTPLSAWIQLQKQKLLSVAKFAHITE